MMRKPSPKMQEALNQIKDILNRHDISASITMVSPEESLHSYIMQPDWSFVSVDDDEMKMNITFKSSRDEFRKASIKLDNAVYIFESIKEEAEHNINVADQILQQIQGTKDGKQKSLLERMLENDDNDPVVDRKPLH